jgi:hypothetical protein
LTLPSDFMIEENLLVWSLFSAAKIEDHLIITGL